MTISVTISVTSSGPGVGQRAREQFRVSVAAPAHSRPAPARGCSKTKLSIVLLITYNEALNISHAMLSRVLLIPTDLELEAGAGHDAGAAGDGAGRPLSEGGPQAVDILCTAVLQKVASELHPKVHNHGEGPY